MLCVPARVSLITALPGPAEQMSLPAALGAPEWLPVSGKQTLLPHITLPNPNNRLPAASSLPLSPQHLPDCSICLYLCC